MHADSNENRSQFQVGANGVPPTSAARDAALAYLRRGWRPIPMPPGETSLREDWAGRPPIAEADLPQHFPDGVNVGVLLGEPSDSLVAIELVAEEALRFFAPKPSTIAFGIPSRPWAHRLCRSVGAKSEQFVDPINGESIINVLSTGAVAVFPGSVHPTGAPISFDGDPQLDNLIEMTPADLREVVARRAAAALLVRHAQLSGERGNAILVSLGRALRDDGWWPCNPDRTDLIDNHFAGFLIAVAKAGGNEEWSKRDAHQTVTWVNTQPFNSTGWPQLAELLGAGGDQIAAQMRSWLPPPKRAAASSVPTLNEEDDDHEQDDDTDHDSRDPRVLAIGDAVANLGKQPRVSIGSAGILRSPGEILLYGQPESGKSYLALREGLEQAREGNSVLYLAFERYESTVRRSPLVWAGLGQTDQLPASFEIARAACGDPKWLREFLLRRADSIRHSMNHERLESLRPLLIIDTYGRALEGDENGTVAVNPFLKSADVWIETFPLGVIVLLHHPTRKGEHPRGSIALDAWCDMIWRLDQDGGTGRRRLLCEKASDEALPPSRTYEMQFAEKKVEFLFGSPPAQANAKAVPSREQNGDGVAAALRNSYPRRLTKTDLRRLGFSGSRVNAELSRLVETGQVGAEPSGRQFRGQPVLLYFWKPNSNGFDGMQEHQ